MENVACRYDIYGLAKELDSELGDIAILFINYIDEMKSEVKEMNRFFSLKDWYMLERTVHNIKGVSVNLGIRDVYEQAEAFDRLLKDGKVDSAAENIEKITQILSSAVKEIKAFFNQNGFSI